MNNNISIESLLKRLSTFFTENKFLLIGLTGSSGAGKNAVADILKTAGMCTIDADIITHRVLEENKTEIASTFQRYTNLELISTNGELNRKALAQVLFSNPNHLKQHEHIVFPKIVNKIKTEIIQLALTHKMIILNAPTLHKTSLINECHAIFYVDACYCVRLKRIKKRDNISTLNIIHRFKNQKNIYKHCKKHTNKIYKIKNNGSYEKLEKNINLALNNLIDDL